MFYGKFTVAEREQFGRSIASYNRHFHKVHAADNLITFNRNMSFKGDKHFMDAFSRNCTNRQEESLLWRLHILCWAAKTVQHVQGDIVECGVYKGFSMAVLADYIEIDKQDKIIYLYDTYEGIPEEYNSENRSNRAYDQIPNMHKIVCEKFAKYQNVKIIKGIVPHSFQITCPQKISLLHIDMNSSRSEIAALEHLFDLVTSGGIIVFDDFGWLGYDKQTEAELAWLGKRNQHILELPTGQGVVIKR